MEYNIINIYLRFIKNKFLDFFKIILNNKYNSGICKIFISRYIDVRYYNETNYFYEKDFVSRLNKEFISLYKKLANEENNDALKNIVALFGYLIYFDDIGDSEPLDIIDALIKDDVIIKASDENIENSLKEWFKGLTEGKEKFYKTLETKDFSIEERKVYRKIKELVLNQNVKVSNLYSEYAIDKAYNTGTVNEDKLFVTLIKGSSLILENAIKLDFSKFFVVDLPSSLLDKDKKLMRLLGVIDNMLAKKHISIRITYSDYIKHKELIDKLIQEGYSFGVIIDNEFKGKLKELFIFIYIFVSDDNEYYKMIMDKKKDIISKVIKY